MLFTKLIVTKLGNKTIKCGVYMQKRPILGTLMIFFTIELTLNQPLTLKYIAMLMPCDHLCFIYRPVSNEDHNS